MEKFLPLFFILSGTAIVSSISAIIMLLISTAIQRTKIEFLQAQVNSEKETNNKYWVAIDQKLDTIRQEMTELKVQMARHDK